MMNYVVSQVNLSVPPSTQRAPHSFRLGVSKYLGVCTSRLDIQIQHIKTVMTLHSIMHILFAKESSSGSASHAYETLGSVTQMGEISLEGFLSATFRQLSKRKSIEFSDSNPTELSSRKHF